jgi:hypothetical protein
MARAHFYRVDATDGILRLALSESDLPVCLRHNHFDFGSAGQRDPGNLLAERNWVLADRVALTSTTEQIGQELDHGARPTR